MKIDYKLCAKLSKAAFSSLSEELHIAEEGKEFNTDIKELMGMYLTIINIFIELIMLHINETTRIPKNVLIEDIFKSLTFCFLHRNKH